MGLIYIGNASDSVYDTQSRALVNELRQRGLSVEHFEGLTIGDYLRSGSPFHNFKKRRFPILPVFPGLIFIQFLFLATSVVRVAGLSKSVVHIRSDVLGSIFVRYAWLLGIKEEQVVIDVRGATYSEFIEYRYRARNFLSELRKVGLKFLRRSLRERKCRFTAISLALSNYVTDTYAVECEVVPCISPFKWSPPPTLQAKLRAREDLGLPIDALLVVAVNGGGSPWQLEVKDIETIASKNLLVLNLSRQASLSPFVLTRYLTSKDYEKALLASDVALMIRKDSIVNRVAVPIKYLEYSSKSLPIIANRSVDSVVKYIEHTKQGVIINSLDEITTDLVSSLVKIRTETEMTDRCLQWLRSHELPKVAEKYQSIYASISPTN